MTSDFLQSLVSKLKVTIRAKHCSIKLSEWLHFKHNTALGFCVAIFLWPCNWIKHEAFRTELNISKVFPSVSIQYTDDMEDNFMPKGSAKWYLQFEFGQLNTWTSKSGQPRSHQSSRWNRISCYVVMRLENGTATESYLKVTARCCLWLYSKLNRINSFL